MIGIIRAITPAIIKVVCRLVRIKTSPIIRGPMVIPNEIMALCMAMKPARCSKGATPAAMARWLGKFNPWAIPKRIVGNIQSHRLGAKGVIAIARK